MNTIKGPPAADICAMLRADLPVIFQTMLGLSAVPMAEADPQLRDQDVVVGSVGFTGEANGMVYVHMRETLAHALASRMLSVEESVLDHEMVNDVVGELSNMIVGSVKSQLCDAGTPCVLTIPTIVRGRNLNIEQVGSAQRRVLGFSCANDRLLLELLLKTS
jgi:chemotaxis protein CheX